MTNKNLSRRLEVSEKSDSNIPIYTLKYTQNENQNEENQISAEDIEDHYVLTNYTINRVGKIVTSRKEILGIAHEEKETKERLYIEAKHCINKFLDFYQGTELINHTDKSFDN